MWWGGTKKHQYDKTYGFSFSFFVSICVDYGCFKHAANTNYTKLNTFHTYGFDRYWYDGVYKDMQVLRR